MKKNNDLLTWAILIFLALVWGSSFILIKWGLVAFQPEHFVGLRVGIAAVSLSPFLVYYLKRITGRDLFWLALAGIFGNAIPAFLFPFAETKLGSGLAGIMNSLSPLFTMALAMLLFRKKFPVNRMIGVLIGLAGAVWLVFAGDPDLPPSENLVYGLALVLATLFYGFATNVMKEKLGHLPPLMVTSFQLGSVGVPCIIWLFTGTDFIHVMETHPDAWSSLGAIALLGALGTALSVVLFTWLLQRTDSIFAASVTYLIPVAALAWGFGAGENITWNHLMGLGVILAGVWLTRK